MNLNRLDLNLIRVFDALMQERSVTRAGEQLGLSQPAVSAALNRLRHEFDDQLFIRRGSDMVPTPKAEELAEPARSALAQIRRMLHSGHGFDLATLDRTFTLFGADFFSIHFMPELARKVRAIAPNVRLRFLDSARGDLGRLLSEDAIDLALERPHSTADWVSSVQVFEIAFKVIAAAGHAEIAKAAIAPGARLPLDLFCQLSHAIRSVDGSMAGLTDASLREIGQERRVGLALPHFQAVARAVAVSDVIAVIPEHAANAAMRELPLALYAPPIDINGGPARMYWHSRHDADPVHRWLRNQVNSALDELTLPEKERSVD